MNSSLSNLAGKASWLIGLGAVAILCCLALWSAWSDYDTTLREAQTKRDALARVADANLASSFRSVDRFLNQIAAESAKTSLDSPAIQLRLGQLLPLLSDAVSIVIADRNGMLRSATDPSAIGADVRSRSYFSYLAENPETRLFISEPFDTITNKHIMVVSRPLLASDGLLEGVVAIAIRPEFFTNTLWAALPGPEGSAVLFGKDYIIRTRVPNDAGTSGKSLKGLPITERFLASQSQVAHYRVQATLDGIERFTTFRQLEFPGNLVLTVSESTASVLSEWSRKTFILVLLTLLGSVLIILLVYLTNRAIMVAERSDATLQQRDILFGMLLKNLPVRVCARDTQGNIIFQSESCCSLTNGLRDHPIQQESDIDTALQTWTENSNRALAGESTTRQHKLFLPNGEHRLVESHFGPIIDGNTIIGMLGVDIDITDFKTIESKLVHALTEKNVMLKEIHHRVKNNLQIIMSLINLQNDICGDGDGHGAFVQTYDRIRSMALVHEHLYKSEELGVVHIAEYIPTLVNKISQAFGRSELGVEIELDIHDVKLSIDRAIPFGLIVNELVTNSFKHAFGSGSTGTLLVRFTPVENGWAELTISDNGPGLPADFDPDCESTLGMRLVSNLAQQLKGSMTFNGVQGAYFRIHIPV